MLPCRILATSSGTDAVLSFTRYSFLLLSTVLPWLSPSGLRHQLRMLLTKSSIPDAMLLSASAPATTSIRAAMSLRALSDVISDFRIFARLWGLLGTWAWGGAVLSNPPTDA